MTEQRRHRLLSAFRTALRAFVRLAIHYNIDTRQLIELTKQTCVEVITDEYGIRNRPTNSSRTALITGLTRKEVRRIREAIDKGVGIEELPETLAVQMIDTWRTNPRFHTGKKPKILPFVDTRSPPNKSGRATFNELVAALHTDLPPGAARTELLRTGDVSAVDKGLKLNETSEEDARRDKQLIEDLESIVPRMFEIIDPTLDKPERGTGQLEIMEMRPIAKDAG